MLAQVRPKKARLQLVVIFVLSIAEVEVQHLAAGSRHSLYAESVVMGCLESMRGMTCDG